MPVLKIQTMKLFCANKNYFGYIMEYFSNYLTLLQNLLKREICS